VSEPSAPNKPQNGAQTELPSLRIGDTCEIDVKMRWADADSLQHLNNAVYFRYMEEGRISMFYSGNVPHNTGCGPVVVHCSCDFKKQITYPATIRVRHRLVSIGRSSMEHEVDLLVIEGAQLELRAQGRSVLVWMDFEAEKSRPWPPEVLAALATTVNRS
jgi:acyl-CoA thioester hydrolase